MLDEGECLLASAHALCVSNDYLKGCLNVAKKRNKLLIVDGYNVLRSGSRYLHMRNREDFTYEKFNMVREALISDVAAYAGS